MTTTTISKLWIMMMMFYVLTVESFQSHYKEKQNDEMDCNMNTAFSFLRESESLPDDDSRSNTNTENNDDSVITKMLRDIETLQRQIEILKVDIQPDLSWVDAYKDVLKMEIQNKIGTMKDKFTYDIDLYIQKLNNDLVYIERDMEHYIYENCKWGTEPDVEKATNEILTTNRKINAIKWDVKSKMDQIQLDLDRSIDLLKINVLRNLYSTDNIKRQIKHTIDSVIKECNNRFDSIQRNVQPIIELYKINPNADIITIRDEIRSFQYDIGLAKNKVDFQLRIVRASVQIDIEIFQITMVS